jgi:hypothetical protein
MPVPKAPPPGPAKTHKEPTHKESARRDSGAERAAAKEPVQAHRSTVNELLTFLTFVESHPVGTSVNAIVDHYSSHGAYVRIGEVVGYVPLRLMSDPAPRSAREFMKVGESVTLVVDSFVPGKRSIDLAIPGVGSAVPLVPVAPKKAATKRAATKKAAAPDAVEAATPKKAAAPRKSAAKKAAPALPVEAPATPKAPRTKAAAPKAEPSTSAAPKKAAAKKSAAATKPAGAKKAVPPRAATAKKVAATPAAAPKARRGRSAG